MSFSSLTQTLTANLMKQTSLHAKLHELSARQFEILEAHDAVALQVLLNEMDLVVFERDKLEMDRKSCVHEFAGLLGCGDDEVSIESIVTNVSEAEARDLKAASAKLRDAIDELSRSVIRNRTIIEHELSITDGFVKSVTSVPERAGTPYRMSGDRGTGSKLPILNARV